MVRLYARDFWNALFWHNFIMIGAELIAWSYLYFTMIFPTKTKIIQTKSGKYVVGFSLIVGICFFVNAVMNEFRIVPFELKQFGFYSISELTSACGGPLYLPSMIHILVQIFVGFTVLFWKHRHEKNKTFQQQIRFIMFGTAMFFVTGILTDFLFPYFAIQIIGLSSIGMTAMAIIITYAIVKHKLFVIEPITEASIQRPRLILDKGYTYVVIEDEPDKSYKLFADHVKNGITGLCITATNPEDIRRRIESIKTSVICFSDKKKPGNGIISNLMSPQSNKPDTYYAHPTQLAEVMDSVTDFLEKTSGNSVIIMDCLDYIISETLKTPDQRAILLDYATAFIRMINKKNSRLIVPEKRSAFSEPVRDEIIKIDKSFVWTNNWKNILLESVCNQIVRQSKVLSIESLKEIVQNLEREDEVFSSLGFIRNYIVINYSRPFETNRMMLATKRFADAVEKATGVNQEKLVLDALERYGFNKYEYLISNGKSYIVPENEPHYSFDIFQDFLENGYAGLCITRTHPNHLKFRRGLGGESKICWLTDTGKGNYVLRPSLEHMQREIEDFLIKTDKGKRIILLDGIEYLMTHRRDAFDSVLHFIYIASDLVAENDAILIMPSDIKALSEQRQALIRKTTNILEPKGDGS